MKYDSNGRRLASVAVTGAAIFMGAFASNTIAQGPNTTDPALMDYEKITIKFDAQGCPQSADPTNFQILKSKKVLWQAVDDASGNPKSIDYEIYFDPFNGRPLTSNKDGELKSPPFDGKSPPTDPEAPEITYKYTIVSVSCPKKPLDPHFRLR